MVVHTSNWHLGSHGKVRRCRQRDFGMNVPQYIPSTAQITTDIRIVIINIGFKYDRRAFLDASSLSSILCENGSSGGGLSVLKFSIEAAMEKECKGLDWRLLFVLSYCAADSGCGARGYRNTGQVTEQTRVLVSAQRAERPGKSWGM